MKPQFKDACDICKKFDYLKNIDGKCLCQECIKKIEKEKKDLWKKKLKLK